MAITLTTLPDMTDDERVSNLRNLVVAADFERAQQQANLVSIDAGIAAIGDDNSDMATNMKTQLQSERLAASVALARASARYDLLSPALEAAKNERAANNADANTQTAEAPTA